MFCRPEALLAAALLGLGASVAQAAEENSPKFSFTAGGDYSQGTYGLPGHINTKVLLDTLGLQRGSFTGSASLPYLVIDAPASVISRGGGHYIVDPAAPSKRRRREGIGNLLLMGSYALDVGDAPYSLGLGGSVTLPTASKSKGLGTGEVDYGVSANAAYTVGTFAPFLDLGYALPGKSDSFSLNNTLSVSAGTTNTLNDALLASLSFNYEESIANGSKESEQIYGSLTWTLTPKVSLTAYGAAGLAKGSPDLDTGLLFVFGL